MGRGTTKTIVKIIHIQATIIQQKKQWILVGIAVFVGVIPGIHSLNGLVNNRFRCFLVASNTFAKLTSPLMTFACGSPRCTAKLKKIKHFFNTDRWGRPTYS